MKRPASSSSPQMRALEGEVAMLRERERELGRQVDQLRAVITERDTQISKQKNEWAEIYGGMKQEIEGLKQENRHLAAKAD